MVILNFGQRKQRNSLLRNPSVQVVVMTLRLSVAPDCVGDVDVIGITKLFWLEIQVIKNDISEKGTEINN